ncbi:response regulator [Thalassobellus suaedae]|uniref:Response regulator n=1 Tax=Thalassobellus suaedae TaxID=3074124 RepID=A0ABY9Y2K4_9FLAO|nr:response regulator [Flavobacteriaceae bacterium HL-DH10]
MNCKVLLIEDDESTNFIHKLVLKSAGIEFVDEALNGMDACNYLENICPDIIFLDINMPVMDGWEFLKEKYERSLCQHVKIAMLTSSLRPEDRKKAKNYSSIIAYYEKPLTLDKIEELKKKLAA